MPQHPILCEPAAHAPLVEAEPTLETIHHALFVPASAEGWGIRDGGSAEGVATAPGDCTYVYGGMIDADTVIPVAALARFWGRATSPASGHRLVFHTRRPLAELWAQPGVGAALETLGVVPENCLAPETPLLFGRLLVPAPSLAPQHAHVAFGRVLATVGMRLVGEAASARSTAPLHISHACAAIPAFADEAAFDAQLERAGFEILHPSDAPLAEFVRRLEAAALVTSTRLRGDAASPADLLASLAPGRRRLTLGLDAAVPIDTALIDAACRHDTLAFHTEAPDAAAFVRLVQRMIATERLPCRLGDAPAPDLGITLAPRTSCVGAAEGHTDAVLGGPVTGRAQLRTSWGQRCWWEVDWGLDVVIRELRLHLPLVPHAEDARSGLRLLVTDDGVDWRIAAEGVPVAGEPLVLAATGAPWRLRAMRVQAAGDGVLALDQIEAIGTPVDHADGIAA